MLNFSLKILLLNLWIGYFGSFQNDPITINVQYKVKYLSGNKVVIDDVCQLDITKTKSYFYSLGEKRLYELVNEKMQEAKATGSVMEFGPNDIKTNSYRFNVLKNYKAKTAIVIERVSNQHLAFVKDSLSTSKWIILTDKKTINGLECQKATKQLGSLKLTAWFCKSIPLPEGPFYFYGLPGIIVEASNSLGWEASLTSLKYNKNKKTEIEIEPYKLVSEKDFLKAKSNAARPQSSDDKIILPDGTKLVKENN